jgi:DNA-3-methyladenine glycosylase II
MPGLPPVKVERLHALARAALDGRIDARHLQQLERDEALQQLQQLPGIGPFWAWLILVRATGRPDELVTTEPRMRRAVTHYYNLPDLPTDEQLQHLAEPWRPRRTWAAVLFRYAAAREGIA